MMSKLCMSEKSSETMSTVVDSNSPKIGRNDLCTNLTVFIKMLISMRYSLSCFAKKFEGHNSGQGNKGSKSAYFFTWPGQMFLNNVCKRGY